jgi:ADP-glucose pyrophosphorylase
VCRKVIPLLEIREELVNIIKKHNQNKADAKIIASAIQEHQKSKLIAFTLDKNDWKINSLKEKIQELGYSSPEVRFLR